MPQTYVDTDNSNLQDKIYDGKAAGSTSGPAEALMQKMVRKVVDKSADFTTVKSANAKGYTIRLKIEKVEIVDRNTKCRISGEIIRYPANSYGQGGNGMVSTKMTGGATATGTKERSLLDCVEAVTEDLATQALAAMRKDPYRP